MVCKYTGLEHGPEQTDEHFDLNGGNGKKSGDPDANCGEPREVYLRRGVRVSES